MVCFSGTSQYIPVAAVLFGLLNTIVFPDTDSILFEAESFSIEESGSDRCIQVGLFIKHPGTEPQTWNVLNASLNFSATDGMLSGSPAVILSDFGPEAPGLSLPPSSHGLPCNQEDTVNSVTLGQNGELPLVGGFGSRTHLSQVNHLTGRIELVAAGDGRLFSSGPGERQLFAVVIFPIAADSEGELRLDFVPRSLILDGNLLLDDSETRYIAYTLDGRILVRSSWPAPALSGFGLALFLTGFFGTTLYYRRRKLRQL
jgi:hypothetical protein